jgi:aryl-alcohol dehydrogenase-like predicted oxidoreductase
MEYVKLGTTGLEVSRIALGCMSFGDPTRGGHQWVVHEPEARGYIQRALEAGVNFFDTANSYSGGSSEEIVGRALADFADRDQVVIATKVFFRNRPGPNGGGLSRKAILADVDHSLRRLGTDYIDLYQIHRFDRNTPLEETLEALHDVVKAGKVRYLGASSMFAWQFAKALYLQRQRGWAQFVSMQDHYNLLYREEEREMLPLCREEGVGVIPWSPLARGRLTRDWDEDSQRQGTDRFATGLYQEGDRAIVEAVARIAAKRGVSRAQVALAWVASRPGVTAPIVGTSKPQHLVDALAALELELSPEEVDELEAPYTPHEVSGIEV